jgi:prephenate dehydratase
MTTAFLGPRGTFSEDAALLRAVSEDLVPFSTFPACVSAVETGLADEAVLPIENSIEGSINTTLDLLIHETALQIVGELVIPVRHFLITRPGVKLEDIRVIMSHPQPLGQCRRFLERCLPNVEQVAALSTSTAVKDVVQGTEDDRAAIGTLRAAELYGGAILAHDIQDTKANVTRFVVLAAQAMPPTGDDKTSLAFHIPNDIPGALHAILSEFAVDKIQLTKIESRPSKGWLGDYIFLIDFEGHRDDPRIAAVLERVIAACSSVKIFGSYPRFPLESLRETFDPTPPIDLNH